MNPETVNLIIQLATLAAKAALELKQQAGLSDEALLAHAEQNSAETVAAVKSFLEKHQ